MYNGIIFGLIILMILVLGGVIISLLIHVLLIPAVFTPKRIVKEIIKLMNLSKEFTFMELGAGDGRMSSTALTSGVKEVIIYEVSPIFVILAKLSLFITKLARKAKGKITIFSQNLYTADLSKATVVYLHLSPKAMKRLENKIAEATKDGVGVYSYKYEFPNLKATKTFELSNGESLYLYKQ